MEFIAILDHLDPQEGQRLCDLGCGCGNNDVVLCLTGAQVYGVDINKSILGRAKNTAARLQVHPHYCVSDLNSGLSFKSDAFDKAVSYCVLEHLTDPEYFLSEVHRILRPGGKFVLSVDSFSYRDIPRSLTALHGKICDVKKYYSKAEAETLLAKCNLSVETSSFIIKSPASSYLFKKLLHLYHRSEVLGESQALRCFKLLTPMMLFISIISDRLCDDRNGGYWIVILAIKKEPRSD